MIRVSARLNDARLHAHLLHLAWRQLRAVQQHQRRDVTVQKARRAHPVLAVQTQRVAVQEQMLQFAQGRKGGKVIVAREKVVAEVQPDQVHQGFNSCDVTVRS